MRVKRDWGFIYSRVGLLKVRNLIKNACVRSIEGGMIHDTFCFLIVV